MSPAASDVVSALARAAAYRAFALAFQAPTETRLRSLGVRERFAVLEDAFRCLDYGVSCEVAACIERLRRIGHCAEALTSEYVRVFGHTTRGLVCPCETEYGDERAFQQPQQLADISGYYLAFGLTPPAASDLRQDHVACECEFMGFLSLKEARFMADSQQTAEVTETLLVTRNAMRTFLRDHLAHFGRAFASRLAGEENRGYYSAWGALFARFLDCECERAGITGGPAELAVRTGLTDDAPMACGTADELIQIQRRP
jgi:TorA maturation chaperone TorD